MKRFFQELPKVEVKYIVQQAQSQAPGCMEVVMWCVVVAGLAFVVFRAEVRP